MSKQRLIESFSKDWSEPLKINRLPIKESSNKIVHEGKEYKSLSEWEIPVWRLGRKNLNGRTYHESLGKRIEEMCKNLVTAALADHPHGDEGGSVKDILAVSKNPHVREGILWVNTIIVDENFENKLEKMTEAGYGLGVSSSVFGDVDSEGNVLDESVEVERYFDFVLDPSYQVYVTKESHKGSSSTTESTINNKLINEDTNNKGEIPMDNSKQEAMDKVYRLNIKGLMTEAEKKTTLAEKVSAYEDISASIDNTFPDIKESIDEKLTKLRHEAIILAEKATQVDKLTEDVAIKENEKNSLKENFDKLSKEKEALDKKYAESCKLLDELKENYNKSLSVIENQTFELGSRFTAKEYESLVVKENDTIKTKKSYKEQLEKLSLLVEEQKKNINSLKEENSKLKEKETSVIEESVEKKTVSKKEDLELDIRNDREVNNYYNDLCSYDENFTRQDVKEKILDCKTVMEAQRLAMSLKESFGKSSVEQLLDDNVHTDSKHIFDKISENQGYDYTVGGSLRLGD